LEPKYPPRRGASQLPIASKHGITVKESPERATLVASFCIFLGSVCSLMLGLFDEVLELIPPAFEQAAHQQIDVASYRSLFLYKAPEFSFDESKGRRSLLCRAFAWVLWLEVLLLLEAVV
jgi:hypothetical protein